MEAEECTLALTERLRLEVLQAGVGNYGAGNRIRTYDPRITNALLYQLSYPGAGGDSIDYVTRRHPAMHAAVHGFAISFFCAGG